jgi:hypothetical protein
VAVTLWTIREVLDSNLGRDAGNHDSVRGFPQSLQANARDGSSIRPRTLPSKSFPIHYSPIILSLESRC